MAKWKIIGQEEVTKCFVSCGISSRDIERKLDLFVESTAEDQLADLSKVARKEYYQNPSNTKQQWGALIITVPIGKNAFWLTSLPQPYRATKFSRNGRVVAQRAVWDTPYRSLENRELLNNRIPQRWIGLTGPDNSVKNHWPPILPDLSVCDFFLWEFIKGYVYVPPLPATLSKLKMRITAAVDENMVATVWDKFDYRIDLRRASKDGQIEHV
ncbi:hypothetical protein AVEN_27703-1 [Araneus ventricosus]|uniref:Uncharacterized protein n=1 Tax=Araneus ventricosus TaxID=182803 RepID=A0A4Y2TB16_ARAVE|nr:hypothetical protein AVEN_27703-1 [Araneus ventricosus]